MEGMLVWINVLIGQSQTVGVNHGKPVHFHSIKAYLEIAIIQSFM